MDRPSLFKLLLSCVLLISLVSCLTTDQGAGTLPGSSEIAGDAVTTESISSRSTSAGSYVLPPTFNCVKPGTGGSRPGQFNEFQCMVCNCIHESAHESSAGQVAVGRVVMSRLWHPLYPSGGVCDVIYKHKHFSWTIGSPSRNEREILPRAHGRREQVNKCRRSMIEVYEKQDSTAFATHYYSPKGMCAQNGYKRNFTACKKAGKDKPYWVKADGCRNPRTIGNHVFCMGGVGGYRPTIPGGTVAPRYSGSVAFCPISERFLNEI